jgi:hypothetical protein
MPSKPRSFCQNILPSASNVCSIFYLTPLGLIFSNEATVSSGKFIATIITRLCVFCSLRIALPRFHLILMGFRVVVTATIVTLSDKSLHKYSGHPRRYLGLRDPSRTAETNTSLVTWTVALYLWDTNCQIQTNRCDLEHETHSTDS